MHYELHRNDHIYLLIEIVYELSLILSTRDYSSMRHKYHSGKGMYLECCI